MAFVCTENFDSYADGASLVNNTASGGSGWTSNWQGYSGGDAGTVVATQYLSSPNSARITTNQAYRDFTAVTVGTFYYSFRYSGDQAILRLYTGATAIIYQRVSSGNLEYYNGSAYVSLGAVTANVWHTVGIEFDQVNQPYKARYSLNGGAFSAWDNRANGTDTSVNKVLLFGDGNVYIDNINPPAAATSTVTPTSTLAFLGCG
jgi:hypothetical protein